MARIEMNAHVAQASILVAGLPDTLLASITLDTLERTLEYQLSERLGPGFHQISIHGFAPPGWKTDPIYTLPRGLRSGLWSFEEWQEKNILAGLSYFTATRADGTSVRAQIEQSVKPAPEFENFVTLTALAGRCQTSVTIPGIAENIPMDMEPAQVMMARTGATPTPDGRREQTIGCAIRVGGAQVPGIGRVEIEMYQDENPGHIISMNAGSDFPARMTLDVRKRYVTPMGAFYSEREEFEANNIERFPPFGVRFTPVNPTAELKDEKTGQVVGHINLGWLVPLCYLDAANFPPRATPVISPE